MQSEARRFPRGLGIAAIALGLAAGSYGVASAANGSGSGSSGDDTTTTAQPPGHPWGRQRSDETVLTGDTATKVREAALAKVPGGTIVRVETDADGEGTYEAHMTDANGDPVTVYLDASFDVVGVETGRPGHHGPRSSSNASFSA
jgi:peptidase YpeB-like protein